MFVLFVKLRVPTPQSDQTLAKTMPNPANSILRPGNGSDRPLVHLDAKSAVKAHFERTATGLAGGSIPRLIPRCGPNCEKCKRFVLDFTIPQQKQGG